MTQAHTRTQLQMTITCVYALNANKHMPLSRHTYTHNGRTSRQTNSWRGAPDGQQLTVLTEL